MRFRLMGMIVDTSTIVTAKRKKRSVIETFAQLRDVFGEAIIYISIVTLVELTRGIKRPQLEVQRRCRETFIEDQIAGLKIHPVKPEIARLDGRISGQQSQGGISLAFEDLLITSTTTHHSCAVITKNLRHFQLFPGLVVKSF